MLRSTALRFLRHALAGSAAALLAGSFGLVSPAGAATLCPTSGTVGGFGETSTDVSGPLDGTCGANSAVKIDIPQSTDYGKLQFGGQGLTLSGLTGASANVSFTTGGSDQPYFLLSFTDGSDGLGQSNSADQILLIEFQPTTLSGNTLNLDPNSTLFNLYDNVTGTYLQGGQHVTNTLAGWLAFDPSLASEDLQGIWIAEGLTGSNTGAESLTVNSLNVVPEPASMALFGAALVGLGFVRRKRAG
jgi:hypothetical protein